MTKKELILLLFDEHNEKTIKLLSDFPTLLHDLYTLNVYDEACRLNIARGIRTYKQRSRDTAIKRYKMGVNQFYEMKKRVEWILRKL